MKSPGTARLYRTIDPASFEPRQAYRFQISYLVPRPIAWVVTVGEGGVVNCAPFSYFMGVSSHPPVVAFAVGERRTGPKDTLRNIERYPEFTINLVNEELAEKMVRTSADYPYGTSEFEIAQLKPLPSDFIRPPRIDGTPVQLECRRHELIRVRETTTAMILGRVERIHVAADLLDPRTGLVDARKLRAVGRLGGQQYCRVNDIFEIARPVV